MNAVMHMHFLVGLMALLIIDLQPPRRTSYKLLYFILFFFLDMVDHILIAFGKFEALVPGSVRGDTVSPLSTFPKRQ